MPLTQEYQLEEQTISGSGLSNVDMSVVNEGQVLLLGNKFA